MIYVEKNTGEACALWNNEKAWKRQEHDQIPTKQL